MENQITNEEFFKSMSAADWGNAEAIEAEIAEILSKGFTKDVGIKFVRTVMAVRATQPNATVGGVFDLALSAGLSYLGDKDTLAKIRSGQLAGATKPKRKPGVARSTLK
jgi:hypothetical protein